MGWTNACRFTGRPWPFGATTQDALTDLRANRHRIYPDPQVLDGLIRQIGTKCYPAIKLLLFNGRHMDNVLIGDNLSRPGCDGAGGVQKMGDTALKMQASYVLVMSRAGTAGGFGEPARQRLRRLVDGIIAAKRPERPFSDDDTLAEIGITSIDMVTLLLAVESEFYVEVPQHEITADVFRSIATIDSLIRRLAPAAAIA